MQMSASVFSRSRWLAACSTSTSIAASPGTPAALMPRTVQRWNALESTVSANSTSERAGTWPSARWAAETIGPIEAGFLVMSPKQFIYKTLTKYHRSDLYVTSHENQHGFRENGDAGEAVGFRVRPGRHLHRHH